MGYMLTLSPMAFVGWIIRLLEENSPGNSGLSPQRRAEIFGFAFSFCTSRKTLKLHPLLVAKIMKRPAVFIIDMLNDCFGHAEPDRIPPELCSSINQLTAFARANNLPVIWVRQEFEPDLSDAFIDMKRENIRMFIRETSGVQILDELVRDDSDIEIVKKRFSMFYATELESMLDELNADPLILAGVNTHACIRTAAIDAYQRDFEVIIVRECVASKDSEHHEITLDYLDGVYGFLDDVPVDKVLQFEADLLHYVAQNHQDMRKDIATVGKIDDKVGGKLKEIISTSKQKMGYGGK